MCAHRVMRFSHSMSVHRFHARKRLCSRGHRICTTDTFRRQKQSRTLSPGITESAVKSGASFPTAAAPERTAIVATITSASAARVERIAVIIPSKDLSTNNEQERVRIWARRETAMSRWRSCLQLPPSLLSRFVPPSRLD